MGSLDFQTKYSSGILPSPDDAEIMRSKADEILSSATEFEDISISSICGIGGTFKGTRALYNEITGKKDNKGNDIKKGIVQGESRWITFRDDSYTIDSKSRFADIVDRIPLNADELIKALTDAIKAEATKSGTDIKTLEKAQAKADQAKAQQVAEAEKAHKSQKELDIAIGEIVDFFTKNKTDIEIIKPILAKCKEMGYSNPKEISDLEDAKTILAMTLK